VKKKKKQVQKDSVKVREIVSKYRQESGALIPVLQDAQEAFGYLPEHVLQAISKELKVPLSNIYGVVTFYAQFHLKRRGKNIVRCCLGTACYVKGAKEIIGTIKSELKLKPGEGTTPDYRFTLEIVRCIGTCFLAPVIMINNDYYGNLSPNQVPGVLSLYR